MQKYYGGSMISRLSQRSQWDYMTVDWGCGESSGYNLGLEACLMISEADSGVTIALAFAGPLGK